MDRYRGRPGVLHDEPWTYQRDVERLDFPRLLPARCTGITNWTRKTCCPCLALPTRLHRRFLGISERWKTSRPRAPAWDYPSPRDKLQSQSFLHRVPRCASPLAMKQGALPYCVLFVTLSSTQLLEGGPCPGKWRFGRILLCMGLLLECCAPPVRHTGWVTLNYQVAGGQHAVLRRVGPPPTGAPPAAARPLLDQSAQSPRRPTLGRGTGRHDALFAAVLA